MYVKLNPRVSRLLPIVVAALLVIVAVNLFLPVSLKAVYNDVREMIEDWYMGKYYGMPERHEYKYPYELDLPDPSKASAESIRHGFYLQRADNLPVYRHQVVDVDCPRFVTFELCPACGIGHKVTEHLFGVRLANLMNATYVYDQETWLYTKHGDLDWVSNMLGVMSGEMTLETVKRKFHPRTVSPCPIDLPQRPRDRGCNVLYSAPRYPGCCKGTASYGSLTCQWSPFSYKLYASHAGMLRAKYRAAKPTRDLSIVRKMYDPNVINVAWHIRIGDWNPHEGESVHYERVKGVLDEALRGFPVHYFFFSYQDNTRGNNPPEHYEFLARMFGNATFVNNVDTAHTHLLLIEADVLVGSGSGMVTLPALYSDGVVLYHERLRFPDGMDELPGWFPLRADGSLQGTPADVRARLEHRLCHSGRADAFALQCN